MGFFGPSLPIDREEFDWLLACFAWLDRTLGERDRSDGFVPRTFFPDDPLFTTAGTASELFEAIKSAAGLEQWQCRLEQGDTAHDPVETGLPYERQGESSALGTFSVEGNTPVIRYDPALLRDPDALIATLAHELAHLVIGSLGIPPGGALLEEHATDCTAVYMGFGLFLANNARSFGQFSDGAMSGWSSETRGYLSENALVTAQVVFERRFQNEVRAVDALKPYLQSVYRKAVKYMDKNVPDMTAKLDEIDLSTWA